MEDTDRKVLRSNHCLIINTLDLKNTSILDQLQEENVISAEDQEIILVQKTQRSQNDKLLLTLKRKDPSIDSYNAFLRTISKDYNFLAEMLGQTKQLEVARANHLKQEVPKWSTSTCLCHKVLKNLCPEDVSHFLFEKEVISDDTLDEMNNTDIPRPKRVEELILKLQKREDSKHAFEYFHESLKPKYEYLCNNQTPCGFEVYTKCTCHREGRRVLIEQNGKQTKRENRVTRQSRTRSYESPYHLYRAVPKIPLPVTPLMSRCDQYWIRFFRLKENGHWRQHESEIEETWRTHHDNPDIQMTVLRSKLAKYSLYRPDKQKATAIFNQSMELLPKTTLQEWHNVSLLQMRTEMCVRGNKLGQAQSWLGDVRQAMCGLETCIGTGAVDRCEAYYLSNIIRCTQNGTKIETITERAKQCLLTAIEHFKEYKLLDLKNLYTQVPLDIALFALGSNFSNAYCNVQSTGSNSVSEEDIELAEKCLNRFENECFENTTEWSRMWFFIARAAQHEGRKNIQRSIEYLQEAEDVAHRGQFETQETSIKSKLERLREKGNERLFRLNEESFGVSNLSSSLISCDS